MNKRISVIIPNYNKASSIGKCLEAVFSSDYDSFEVIVVDDCSTDNSVEIIRRFPCKLIRLEKHSGASRARNIGAENSIGEIFFFIDSDCILQKITLAVVNKNYPSPTPFSQVGTTRNREEGANGRVIIGGTYTKIPYDDTFFSAFQSIFINYSETKKKEPDYIASHAMAISADIFKNSGGFPEKFLPILEDVEFSHRLRRTGLKLKIYPEIQVQHIFNFTLMRSLANAFRKSHYWTMYSLKNKDLLADSGTASVELKANILFFVLSVSLVSAFICYNNIIFLALALLSFVINLFISRGLIMEFYKTKGWAFSLMASLYYALLYPIPICAGVFSGLIKYYLKQL